MLAMNIAQYMDYEVGMYDITVPQNCLVPVMSCDGWNITTIEGLGNTQKGLDPVQERLANFNGTQCGYCSPGMVMTMKGLLENNSKPKMTDITKMLDGNICRCTGYRSILDSFKSFAVDAPDSLKSQTIVDIEEIHSIYNKTSSQCGRACLTLKKTFLGNDDKKWIKPSNLVELINDMKSLPTSTNYRLIAGNTSTGIYKNDGPYSVYIDIRNINELKTIDKSSDSIIFGSGVTLANVIKTLESVDSNNFIYASKMADHIQHVAHTNIRNVATLGGNLMIKYAHREFSSDIFLLLEAIGATISVISIDNGQTKDYLPKNWLMSSMDRCIVKSIKLPTRNSDYKFYSYKITPRATNAHAYVNGAFLAKMKGDFIIEDIAIVYGGISSSFIHASQAEIEMKGKDIRDNLTLQSVLKILDSEVNPDNDPVLSSPEYRKHLTKALYYKFLLTVLGPNTSINLQNSGRQLKRPDFSTGKQTFSTNPSLFPLNKPISKIEAKAQCSGEATFINDIPSSVGEIHAAFVLTTVANCDIDQIDLSKAMEMPGYIDFVDYRDIPGENISRPNETIFTAGRSEYAGQAVGLVLADTAVHANKAAKKVNISYKNKDKPIMSIDQALASSEGKITEGVKLCKKNHLKSKFEEEEDDSITVTGTFEIGSQYHFHMETQICLIIPHENGTYEVHASTQWMESISSAIAKALNIKENAIEVNVRRLGGAYGGKITRNALISTAAAIACYKTRKPVRLVCDLETNMGLIGKRLPYKAKYTANMSKDGILNSVEAKVWCDVGVGYESTSAVAIIFIRDSYKCKSYDLTPLSVKTHTAANTYCRAPGPTQGHAIIENIIEHLATKSGMDPLDIRMKNMIEVFEIVREDQVFTISNPLPSMIHQLKNSSNYQVRKELIDQFNQNNRWVKRGISLVPSRYMMEYFAYPHQNFYAAISIYHDDGSIVVSHAGIEMGQGINTKVAQAVAYVLKVDMDLIQIKPSNTLVSPNSTMTSGSMGSEFVTSAAMIAARILKERMKPILDGLDDKNDWPSLVKACYEADIDLTARHMGNCKTDRLSSYNVSVATLMEVELDILTGEMYVVRADLIEDTGDSLSTKIDIGQIEGAIVMGIGLWTSEVIKFNNDSGLLLTNNTWEYKPPVSGDIPQDMRITLYNSNHNPNGVMGSKATAEPPFLGTVSVIFALRYALKSAKKDIGIDPKIWFNLNGPATLENIQRASGIDFTHFYV